MIKAGQHIGMGDKLVNLLVEVQSVHGGTMRGFVINGCWDFEYSLATGKLYVDTPTGPESWYTSILFTGGYPKKLHDYNDVIHYMNEHLTSSWYKRLVFKVCALGSALVTFCVEAPTRTVNSIRGMRDGWAAPLIPTDNIQPYDDDIPF